MTEQNQSAAQYELEGANATDEGLVLTHKNELDAQRAALDFTAGGANVRRDGRDVVLLKSEPEI